MVKNEPCETQSYRFGFKHIFSPVNIEHRCDFDEKPPPRPTAHPHELPDIFLDAAYGNMLCLKVDDHISCKNIHSNINTKETVIMYLEFLKFPPG